MLFDGSGYEFALMNKAIECRRLLKNHCAYDRGTSSLNTSLFSSNCKRSFPAVLDVHFNKENNVATFLSGNSLLMHTPKLTSSFLWKIRVFTPIDITL